MEDSDDGDEQGGMARSQILSDDFFRDLRPVKEGIPLTSNGIRAFVDA